MRHLNLGLLRRLPHLFSVLSALAVGSFALSARAQPGSPTDAAQPQGEPSNSGAAGSASEQGEAAPAAPTVVPPKLVYFQEGKYPPAAFEQGLEAEVLLKLLVQADGTVGKVEVLQPVGNGFDEAAAEAAKRFLFTPAQRDGKSVPVFIKYAYRFEAKEVDVSADELPAPTTGNLEGKLLVAGEEVPLAGAVVVAIGADGSVNETLSDATGYWRFEDLAPGTYQVSVNAGGYAEANLTEAVNVGEATEVVYRLTPESDGIDVIVTGQRPPREVTKRVLDRREIAKVPGTGGDALRSIQSLPGVARPPGLAGLLIVRGSSPNDTNVFIDGALVPLVYHFGGLSSVVPTELLDRIDFYPGNFSAKYGRVMGGVVDVALRTPDTLCTGDYGKPLDEDGCFHGFLQVDLIDTRVLLRGPITDDWSFAIAGRRSWIDTWVTPVLEEAGAGVTSAPVYHDYQIIVENRPNPYSRFRAQFYGSDDLLELIINNPSAEDPAFGGNVQFGTEFYRGQLIYETKLSQSWDLYSTLAIGRDAIRFAIGPAEFDLETYPIELRTEFAWSVFKGFRLNGGLDFLTIPFEVLVRAPEPPRPGEPDPGPFSSRPILETDVKSTAFRPGWYLEGEVQPTERLLIVPGLRVDFARDSGHADFSPRINARYTLRGADSEEDENGNRPRRTTLKAGAGVFAQPPTFQETDEVFGTPNLESNQSTHFAVGVEQELTDQIELSVEGYYKNLFNLVSRSPSLAVNFDYDNLGRGSVIGAETLLKYKPDDRFFGWLAYTLSRSVRQNRPDEEEFLFQFDQTHILTMLGSYRLGDGWEMGARFRLVSGNMTTPVRRFPDLAALYAADAGAYVPLEGQQFSDRLPLFHQLDVRVEKTWQFRDWKLVGYLDVWNAYNNAAVEDIEYSFNFEQNAPQTGLPIIPSFGIRGEF